MLCADEFAASAAPVSNDNSVVKVERQKVHTIDQHKVDGKAGHILNDSANRPTPQGGV